MHRYKDLKVWQKAVDLSVIIYKITEGFPKKEQYSLSQQMNRAVVSIASNIAEGAGRNSDKEFLNFLSMSVGSSFELETQLVIANKIGYVDEKSLVEIGSLIKEIQNMIYSLQETLRKKVNLVKLKS